MDIRKVNLRHLGLVGFVAMMVAVTPSIIQKSRVVQFKKSMTIQTSKIDPPRLAFDEVHAVEINMATEWDFLKAKEGATLRSGDPDFKFVGKTPTQILSNRKVVLRTMSFKREEVLQETATSEWMESLSTVEQRRIRIAQEKYRTLDDNWTLPTQKDLAETKIKEVTRSLESENKQSQKILVQSQLADGSVRTPQSIRTASVEVRRGGAYDLSGYLEVKGLPSGSPRWQVRLARYEDETKKEDGNVDLKNSTYSIKVPSLSGTIIAEMIDVETGFVLGEGRLRLSEYSKEQILGKAKLVIEKTNHEVAVNMGSFYNNPTTLGGTPFRREKPINTRVLLASLDTEGRTDERGTFRFEQVKKGSWTLVRTEAKGFQPGIHVVQSGSEKRLPLFPTSMISALKEIVREQTKASEVPETDSIVWGQVVQDGKPLAGVELDVEFMEQYHPVYFNSLLIPDPTLKATSENGYFAFVHLPAGFHSLVASNGRSYLSHFNLVVDDDTVSTALLESSMQSEKADVKVFDAFSGKPMKAHLELQSLPAALDVHGYAQIQMAPISRLSFMNVTPNQPEYVRSFQVYNDDADAIHAPLIRADWLQALMAARKINSLPNMGVILGFVESAKYEVYLAHHSQFPKENIVYFDAQGNPSQASAAGGGFVIFNVPVGVESVVVMNSDSNLLQSQILPTDASILSVLKFK